MAAELMTSGGGSAGAGSTSSTAGASKLGTGFIVAGAIAQGVGQLQANADQARQETQNAAFYRQQAQFATQAMIREMDIANKDYTFKIGQQVSGYAKGGVDVGSGSASALLAASAADRLNTLSAIRLKGQQDYDLAMSRAIAAENAASELGSFQTQLITVAKSAAVVAATVYGGPAGGLVAQEALSKVAVPQASEVPTPTQGNDAGFMTGPGWSTKQGPAGTYDYYSPNDVTGRTA